MTKKKTLEQIVKQFEPEGLTAVMKTPPKIVRFPGSSSTRQSSRHKGDQLKMDTRCGALVLLTVTYENLREAGAPDIQLVKHAKYPTLLPLMSKDVIQEGALLGQIPNLKYQD